MNPTDSTPKEIAVLAGPAMVDALRLAGVRRARVIEAGAETAGEVRAAIREWTECGEVGVIAIGEELAVHVRDTLAHHRKAKRFLPVILELPSPETTRENAVAYYRRLSRDFLGLEIELESKTGIPEEGNPPGRL